MVRVVKEESCSIFCNAEMWIFKYCAQTHFRLHWDSPSSHGVPDGIQIHPQIKPTDETRDVPPLQLLSAPVCFASLLINSHVLFRPNPLFLHCTPPPRDSRLWQEPRKVYKLWVREDKCLAAVIYLLIYEFDRESCRRNITLIERRSTQIIRITLKACEEEFFWTYSRGRGEICLVSRAEYSQFDLPRR
jgi:hypothetical protein